MILKEVYRKFIPEKWRLKVYRYRSAGVYRMFRKRFLEYYSGKDEHLLSNEEKDILEYVKENIAIPVFPYGFTANYKAEDIVVFQDDSTKLKYVLHDNKKLYYKRGFSDEAIRQSYNCLRIEQDERSPHRYLTREFDIKVGDVIIDAGCGEGNFSLSNIEKAKKIYIFESDPEWVEALAATFRPWEEKVIIYNKRIGNEDEGIYVTLDNVFSKEKIDFLKIDVDGAEKKLLEGASGLLKEKRINKIAICTYHKINDGVDFFKMLSGKGFTRLSFSDGFMFFLEDLNQQPPFFRRGILRAEI
jgi:hypothetical protein